MHLCMYHIQAQLANTVMHTKLNSMANGMVAQQQEVAHCLAWSQRAAASVAAVEPQ